MSGVLCSVSEMAGVRQVSGVLCSVSEMAGVRSVVLC